jgi:uncharacterized membrane protein YphA (DoxX/SURF4 family)
VRLVTARLPFPAEIQHQFLNSWRYALNTNKFSVGVSTVLMLVLLRLALGWHFLYEGIWKVRHADQFVGEMEGFISAARGPLAGRINGMIPDIDGHQRLEVNLAEVAVMDDKGNATKQLRLASSWDHVRQQFVDFYRPANGDEDANKLHEKLAKEANKVYIRHVGGLNEFVKENGAKIKAHFEAQDRYEEGVKSDPRTMFQTQRRWDELQDLRKEAKGWIADLDARENALKAELMDLLRTDFSPLADGKPAAGTFARSRSFFSWKRTEQMAFLLSWTLLAVGLCLMLGLFTRPAALMGAVFLLFVVMSQPSYNGVYPLDPPQMGHAMLVNKDFVELIALLVIASTSLGRWTGMDYFLHKCCCCCWRGKETTPEGRKA